MCGIAGLLDATKEENLSSQIQQMTDQLYSRGPDGDGIWVEKGIALGHRRLAILDLSPSGAQPMASHCGRFIIAYNGEIYNHLDLRRDLTSEGAAPKWRGQSDTETLLACIVHWGLDATLKRTAGMFAIALWDRQDRRLSLSRDRIGEKPLYWGWAGNDIVFGSELKALRQHPNFQNRICRESTVQYLQYGYVPTPRSIYENIYKLEPGCVLEIPDSPPLTAPKQPLRPGEAYEKINIRRYWSLDSVIKEGATDPIECEQTALKTLERTLNTAVAKQMIADVPLGAFLSGGVDSSLIVALMQSQSNNPVKTFTVGFEDAAYDESPHAAAVAAHLGTDHNTLLVTENETISVIPKLPDLYDEPFADSSQIPTHLICQMARQHVTVALSGDAADELFGGYNRYFWGPRIWNRLQNIPKPIRHSLAHAIKSLPVSGWNRIGDFQQRIRPGTHGVTRLGEKAHKLAGTMEAANDIDSLYRALVTVWSEPSHLVLGGKEPVSVLENSLQNALKSSPAERMMTQDMQSYLPDDILCKVDRAAMGVSLETRVPFLDPDLIALSARLPLSMKVKDGTGKWALREILNQNVPRELIERPKTGFGIPIGDWLRGILRDWAEDLLSPEKLGADGLLDPAPIRQVWAEHLSGRRDWTHRLWTILMLQAWRERWE